MNNLPLNIKITILFIISILLSSIILQTEYLSLYNLLYDDKYSYADKRNIFGINNFFNSMSCLVNITISILISLYLIIRINKGNIYYNIIAVIFILNISLLHLLSFSYHYQIYYEQTSIYYENIILSNIYISILSYFISRNINNLSGILSIILLMIANITLQYLAYKELLAGNIYLLINILPFILVIFILYLFPKEINYQLYIKYSFIMYITAKIFEYYDYQIYIILMNNFSGYAIANIFKAISLYYIFIYLYKHNIEHTNNENDSP